MYPQSLRVVLKAQADHRVQDILSTYRFTLLQLTFLRSLGSDEADELGHALLNTFLRIFGDLCRWRHCSLHYTRDISNLYAANGRGMRMSRQNSAEEKTGRRTGR